MLGFEFIPEDPQFRIGTRKADKQKASASSSEINDAITPVSAGYLARYPVTVAQFRAFVEATQFELGDQDALRDPDNHPVRWVSWHEARAYCDWLNQQLLTHSTLQASPVAQWVREGWRIGLPSELEWEHAARGGKRDLVYPWGDQPDPNRANYDDTRIRNTSSVGCFPPNDYGLYDMIGNLLEWTRSLWGKDWQKTDYGYPYVADDGREDLNAGDDVRRVLRGGSWYYYPQYSRAANRLNNSPAVRGYSFGFRLARTLP
jgi:formylglycine-generating enzyme required for sulfatase activity